MRQIVELAAERKPDAVVVSGDIFDRSTPSQAARELFINTLMALREKNPGMAIVVTAGNHDGKLLLDNDGRIFSLGGITIVGQVWRTETGEVDWDRHIVEVFDADHQRKGYIVAVPHIYDNSYPLVGDDTTQGGRMQRFFQTLLDHVRQRNTEDLPVVLSAHLFLKGCDVAGHEESEFDGRLIVGSCECVGQSVLGSGYDYLALGHIHKPQNVKDSKPLARYCGTPLPLTFDEGGNHGVSLVTLERAGEVPQVEAIGLRNIRPLLTLPEKPTTFAAVVADLLTFNPETEAYVRLNVLDDQPLPADYHETLNNIFKGTKARYCTMKHTANVAKDDSSGQAMPTSFTPDNMPSPLELAQIHYRKRYGNDMGEDLVRLFNEATEAVMREDLENEQ